MIPLHLRTTTVHVDEEQAEALVTAAVAEWLPGVKALVSKLASDAETLAVLA